MKKVLFIAICLCGCTSTHKQEESVNQEVIDSTEIDISPEEWEILTIIY